MAEEIGALRSSERTLSQILDACRTAGFDGSSTLVEFISARVATAQDTKSADLLQAENEALLAGLRGKHAITGATYAALIAGRDGLKTRLDLLESILKKLSDAGQLSQADQAAFGVSSSIKQ